MLLVNLRTNQIDIDLICIVWIGQRIYLRQKGSTFHYQQNTYNTVNGQPSWSLISTYLFYFL